MTPADLLPRDRREVVMAGCALLLGVGASLVPGVTVEPREATQTRSDLASCTARLEGCVAGNVERDDRIRLCWEQYRTLRER